MTKKKPSTKTSNDSKHSRTGEALRKQAIADADRNIAAIDAAERGASKTKPAKQRTAAKPHPRINSNKKLSGLDVAAKVLTGSKEPLNATAIAERAIAAGWKTDGQTPHATLSSAMIREIAHRGRESRFKKTERGLFTATGK
jgi:hypothetical protein